MTALAQAAALAKKERAASKNGRTRYSQTLKELLATASKETSKTRLSKETGISYPTILKIVGTNKVRRKTAKAAKPAGKSNVSVEISVDLPSNTTLRYSSLKALRADAEALKNAARQVS